MTNPPRYTTTLPAARQPRATRRGAGAALLAAFACAAAVPAQAQPNVGVSVHVSQPGVYGRVDIGSVPPPAPALVYAQPVLVQPPPPPPRRVAVVRPQPVYMWVPPGHRKNWSKHCARYGACGVPVYFVQDGWYREHALHGRGGPLGAYAPGPGYGPAPGYGPGPGYGPRGRDDRDDRDDRRRRPRTGTTSKTSTTSTTSTGTITTGITAGTAARNAGPAPRPGARRAAGLPGAARRERRRRGAAAGCGLVGPGPARRAPVPAPAPPAAPLSA